MRNMVCGIALLAAAAVVADEGGWTLGVDEDAWPEAVVLARSAGETVRNENGTKDVRPVLELRCTPPGGSPELSVDWGRFISSFGTEIGLSVDGGEQAWFDVKVDDSNRITRTDRPADVEAMLAMLEAGDTLAIEVPPYAGEPITVTFGIDGYAAAAAEFEARCR